MNAALPRVRSYGPELTENEQVIVLQGERIEQLEGAMRMLITAYVATLEGGRDRIKMLGGDCDDVPTMEAGDPALRHARRVLTERNPGAKP